MALVDEMLAQLKEQKARIEPILEGFRDYVRVGLVKTALQTAQKAVTAYQNQLTTIEAAITALLSYQQQAALPRYTLSITDRENFSDQRKTMALADAQLDTEAEEEVESGKIVLTPTPKPT